MSISFDPYVPLMFPLRVSATANVVNNVIAATFLFWSRYNL